LRLTVNRDLLKTAARIVTRLALSDVGPPAALGGPARDWERPGGAQSTGDCAVGRVADLRTPAIISKAGQSN